MHCTFTLHTLNIERCALYILHCTQCISGSGTTWHRAHCRSQDIIKVRQCTNCTVHTAQWAQLHIVGHFHRRAGGTCTLLTVHISTVGHCWTLSQSGRWTLGQWTLLWIPLDSALIETFPTLHHHHHHHHQDHKMASALPRDFHYD